MVRTTIKICNFDELIALHSDSWCDLFSKCFNTTHRKARKVLLNKYNLNSGFVALLLSSDRVCASYSVISDKFDRDIALSVDTMSDGTVRSATKLLSESLYPILAQKGINTLIGYPNENVIDIRIKKLNWRYLRTDKIYIGFRKKSTHLMNDFLLIRPKTIAFSGGMLGMVLSNLSHFGIGIGYQNEVFSTIRFKISEKRLCYKSLRVRHNINDLTTGIESIDVP